MVAMKRNGLLFHVKLIVLLLTGFSLLSCKKKLKEVEVNVYDVNTNKGLKDVSVIHGDTEYKSDVNGKVLITKNIELEGDYIYTNFGLTNLFNADYHTNCILINEYQISDKTLDIPVAVSKVIKLKIDIVDSVSERRGCFVLDDLPHCSGEFHQYFERFPDYLDFPGKPSWDRSKDFINYFMVLGSSPAILKVYYDCKEGWDNNAIEPDIYEEIVLVENTDTTYYTLLLK